MAEAGYSGTPLLKKLGYRDGQRALLIGAPSHLTELAGFPGFAQRIDVADPEAKAGAPGPFDRIHVFERDRAALADALPGLRARLDPGGAIWVSWPKRASGVPTTLTEDAIRALGLVDVVWSCLELMIPRALSA